MKTSLMQGHYITDRKQAVYEAYQLIRFHSDTETILGRKFTGISSQLNTLLSYIEKQQLTGNK